MFTGVCVCEADFPVSSSFNVEQVAWKHNLQEVFREMAAQTGILLARRESLLLLPPNLSRKSDDMMLALSPSSQFSLSSLPTWDSHIAFPALRNTDVTVHELHKINLTFDGKHVVLKVSERRQI